MPAAAYGRLCRPRNQESMKSDSVLCKEAGARKKREAAEKPVPGAVEADEKTGTCWGTKRMEGQKKRMAGNHGQQQRQGKSWLASWTEELLQTEDKHRKEKGDQRTR